jgi:PTS system fructose-specific IIA component/PTS system nitrogen regulatory IIA component
MKFSDFVATDAIRARVEADNKEGVVREMVRALVEAGKVARADEESIFKAIMKREDLGSTGIGRGVAVPHTKHPGVTRLVGTVAVSPAGIDFESLDGDPVHLFFLLVSPPDRPGDHLRALENISRQLRDDTFCRLLKAAKGPVDIQHLLEEADSQGVAS